MTKVRCDMSVSLDGFVCGAGAKESRVPEEGFFRVTSWATELASWRARIGWEGGVRDADDELYAEGVNSIGAYVMGRGMCDGGMEPWGEKPPFRAPVFVITHRPHEPIARKGGTTFHFVTGGVGAAVEQAKAAAGGRNVAVSGGAIAVQQVIAAGLLDELHLHVAPVLLGDGIRLLDGLPPGIVELESSRVVNSPRVTHLSYTFPRQGADR